LLAGLAAQSLIVGGVTAGILTFSTAAFVLVMLLFSAAVGVALSQESTVARFRTSGPAIKRWGGRILVIVGVWLIALGLLAGSVNQILFSS
jgi:hypothetical protein